MQDTCALFKKLVSIDSPSGHEKNISDFIFQYLKDLELGPYRDKHNMIFCHVKNSKDKGKPKLFCSHMDTVEPGQNIKIIENECYFQSDGTTILGADNKITIAILLSLTQKLLASKIDLNYELLFTVREETNSGISEFDTDKINSNVAFVFDGGNNLSEINLQAPTIQDVIITIRGKSAHVATPEMGSNSLETLINSNVKLGRIDSDTTFNIGIIKGGSATNSIPETVVLKGDLRSLSHKKFLLTQKDIERIFKGASRLNKTKVEFNWIPYSYAYKNNIQSKSFINLKNIYKKLGFNITSNISTGGSDAGYLNYKGIEAFCLGYGVENSHTTQERISTDNIQLLSKIIENIIKKF